MRGLFRLTDAQLTRLEPYFPKFHRKPRVDDRRVLSCISFINRNGLRWCDAPKAYGPYKTLHNRWKDRSRMDMFARILAGLAAAEPDDKTEMIDATHFKTHPTATSLRVKIQTDSRSPQL